LWDDKHIAFDYETSGTEHEYALQPWRLGQGCAWATSFVWAGRMGPKMRAYGGLEPTVDMMREMLEHAVEHRKTIVGWNTVFDISWLLAYGLRELVYECKWLDGMLLWRHLEIEPEYDVTDRFKKRPYTLKEAVRKFLPAYAGYEEDVDFHDDSPEARAKLHKYNERDVLFTFLVTKHLYQLLEANPRQLAAAKIEADCLPLVAEANLHGMPVDKLHTRALRDKLTQASLDALAELEPHGVTEKVIRSPVQLSKLMFDEWGLPVIKTNTSAKTGKTSRSTDKEVLHELSFIDNRVATLQQYREALNNRTKFAEAPLKSADYNEDDRTRPGAIVFGTYSGRLTYASKQGRNKDERQTGFALHQMKNGDDFRSVIRAPEGYTLIEFDAAGQEFRWMAIATGDETMLSLCEPGEDAHSFMGAQIAHADYHEMIRLAKVEGDADAKQSRKLGKVANLSLQYRTTAPKLRSVARVQYGLPMELPEAKHIRDTYLRSYPGVPTYWNRQIAQTRATGYVETFAGRRVQVQGAWDGPMGWKMGSTAINYRIQGTGADQKYLALSVLRNYLPRVDARFGWDLHDGIYLFVPDEHVERVTHEGKYLLDNLPYKKAWGFEPPVPLPWDCKRGKSWGKLKEFDYG